MSFNLSEEICNERLEKPAEMRSEVINEWRCDEINLAGSDTYSSVSYVSDGDLFTNEDFQENNESPRTPTRLVSELKEKVDSLQRKNETMEQDYYYLQAQVSSLEDVIVKKRKELNSALEKLSVSNQLVAINKQRHEEAEEKLSSITEENKHITIQLSHFEKENAKLNVAVINLENQIDSLARKNVHESKKSQDMYTKLKSMNDSLSKYETELQILKRKEKCDQEALARVLDKNLNLQQQNATNLVIIQDLKLELKAAIKKLAEVQNSKITSKLQPEECSDDLSDDDSKTIFGDNFALDSTIPFESSLFAELEDELIPDSKCCDCMWEKSVSTPSSKSVNTEKFETSDVAVNTECNSEMYFIEDDDSTEDAIARVRDSGLDDTIKASSLRRKIISKIACFQTQKRPSQRH